ncbi:30S ribosomal protein THX [Sphingobacterium alkalisoli]|uniref:30S ribosomal protein THX n=1 Tax=Sphingobacterium alkalisoli TaxID=1874115 RepID=A0A4U0H8Z3_9SPHI|nr:30S ribosomal protein THX [Sphingobacterium alkalisoli]TJY66942.1 30S ribosomal protein THX [Sphingobacterium alkalisoli]
MGKGDKKTRKGKIVMGSYGNSRPGAKNQKPKKEEVPAKEE